MLEKLIAIDQITITENGCVFYRTATRILEDGQMISQAFHRTSLRPGEDFSYAPENVQNICRTVWTPQVVDAYKQSMNLNKEPA